MLKADLDSCSARRGNHDVMMRGTLAKVRVKSLMLSAKQDGDPRRGHGRHRRRHAHCPACEEYGTSSSRDWAAKGKQLLGIKAVLVKSYRRIHRSNLIGISVLPLQFNAGDG